MCIHTCVYIYIYIYTYVYIYIYITISISLFLSLSLLYIYIYIYICGSDLAAAYGSNWLKIPEIILRQLNLPRAINISSYVKVI